jgi:hypothetical protein
MDQSRLHTTRAFQHLINYVTYKTRRRCIALTFQARRGSATQTLRHLHPSFPATFASKPPPYDGVNFANAASPWPTRQVALPHHPAKKQQQVKPKSRSDDQAPKHGVIAGDFT